MRAAMRDFTRELTTPKAHSTVLAECLEEWNGPLGDYGYKLVTQSEVGLTYNRTYRPWPVWVVCVLLFPLGLLALLVRSEAPITATITPEDEETRVFVSGRAPKGLRRAFQGMDL
jgi:hypothetical protein